MRAVDVSNYTGPLSPETLDAWKNDGTGLVIVQAIDPPAGFPPGCTRQQIQACATAGIPADAYVFLWFNDDASSIQHRLSLLDGLDVRRLWLDVEDNRQTVASLTAAQREAQITAALQVMDAYRPQLGPTGIYSAAWFWLPATYMANSWAFKDRPLWFAQYDGVEDAGAFTWFGGWATAAIKQYAGSSVYLNQGGVDLNVLGTEEVARLSGQAPATATADPTQTPADPAPRETPDDWPWPTWRDAAINWKGIADTLGQQLAAARNGLAPQTANATS